MLGNVFDLAIFGSVIAQEPSLHFCRIKSMSVSQLLLCGNLPGVFYHPVWQPTPVVLPRESHGQRSLAGYGPQAHKESDMTEATQQASSILRAELFWTLFLNQHVIKFLGTCIVKGRVILIKKQKTTDPQANAPFWSAFSGAGNLFPPHCSNLQREP